VITADVTLAVAFAAGVFSFLSPCVLPLIPTYLTYLTGVSLEELIEEKRLKAMRLRVMSNAVAFVLGFSTLFILYGLSASFIGQFLLTYQRVIRQLSGLLIIFFGLHLMGVFRLGFLERSYGIKGGTAGGGNMASSFLVGTLFSAGWTPCIGPVLASILTLAASSDTLYAGAYLLGAYSLGLAIPFLLAAASLGWFMKFFRRFKRHLAKVEFVSGLLLTIIGLMVYLNYFTRLNQYFNWSF